MTCTNVPACSGAGGAGITAGRLVAEPTFWTVPIETRIIVNGAPLAATTSTTPWSFDHPWSFDNLGGPTGTFVDTPFGPNATGPAGPGPSAPNTIPLGVGGVPTIPAGWLNAPQYPNGFIRQESQVELTEDVPGGAAGNTAIIGYGFILCPPEFQFGYGRNAIWAPDGWTTIYNWPEDVFSVNISADVGTAFEFNGTVNYRYRDWLGFPQHRYDTRPAPAYWNHWRPFSDVWIQGDADDSTAAVVENGIIPTNWRIVQYTGGLFDATGEIYLGRFRGEEYNRELVFTPAMFTWERRGTDGRWLSANPATIPRVNANWPGALREVHFANSNARIMTSRTRGMDGTIREVILHPTTDGTPGEGYILNRTPPRPNQQRPGGDPALHGNENNVAIRVSTPIFMTRTGSNEVEFDVSIRVANRSFLLGRVSMEVRNDRYYVSSGADWIAPDHREYIRAEDTVRGVEIYAGEGVTFTRNLTANTSVYVAASLWTDYAPEELFQQHPELVDIINIHHTGFNAAGITARIDRNPRPVYYVFNAERRLIGTTNDERLPFSTRYYITTAIIDLAGTGGADRPAEEPFDRDPTLPPGDGSTNVNHNPGTGC